MSMNCPYCAEAINRKSLIFSAVKSCESCGKNYCMGNFKQFLSFGLLGLVSLFGLLFASAYFEYPLSNFLMFGVNMVVMLIGAELIIRPVPYPANALQEKGIKNKLSSD